MARCDTQANFLEFAAQSSLPATKEAGIFTWVIGSDTVYCDDLAAALFGFDSVQARKGLPVSHYLERMHPDDLPRVAKAIHETMITNLPYQENYRVCLPDGSVRELSAYGSCFRGADGEPSHYAGILMQVDAPADPDHALILHLLSAHDIALRDGRLELAAKIASLLAHVHLHQAEEYDAPVVRRH